MNKPMNKYPDVKKIDNYSNSTNKREELDSFLNELKTNEKLDKLNLKSIFNKFYKKKEIPNLSKEKILELVDNNYYKAITILLIYANEQGNTKGFLNTNYTRYDLKKNARKFNNKYFDLVKSIGKWQIRPNSFNNEELEIFFSDNYIQKNKVKKILNTKEFIEYLKFKKIFLAKKEKQSKNKNYLSKKEKIEILENEGLSTLLLESILRVREKQINNLLKNDFNINLKSEEINKNFIYFYTTQLANAYHMGPVGAIRGELTTNIVLKLAEKIGIFETNQNFQKEIRNKYKTTWNSLLGKVNFYARNTDILKESINLIINHYYNKSSISGKDKDYLKKQTENIKNGYIPNELKKFIYLLAKAKKINPIKFNTENYRNTKSSKAILVGNYGPRAWNILNK